MIAGLIYKLRFRARNSIGYSAYSNTLKTALIAKPATPSTPLRTDSSSSKTSIAIDWQTVADDASPGGLITGYNLYMAKGISGSYTLIFNGQGYPTITDYIVNRLETGEFYRFKVSALNFNGEGSLSGELTTYSCIAPSLMS